MEVNIGKDYRSIVLQAFEIENDELSKSSSDLMENLKKKLQDENSNAENRCMKLSEEGPDEDLLSDFSIMDALIFGVMWRIAPSESMPTIPEDFFKRKTIQMSEVVDKGGDDILQRKAHYYFALNKNFMVTNLPRTRVKPLQTYLNWLLSVYRGDKQYKFAPMVSGPNGTRLSDVEKVVFSDSSSSLKITDGIKKVESSGSTKIVSLAKDKLNNLFSETSNLDDLIEKNIVTAKLIVQFSKPRRMKAEDYHRELQAVMKSVDDTDGVSFKLKDGKMFKGTQILRTRSVEVESLGQGSISEKDLMLGMESFLKELNREK